MIKQNPAKKSNLSFWEYFILVIAGSFIIFCVSYYIIKFFIKYHSYPFTPTDGLSNCADLGRVMYETGSLIICAAALLTSVLGFVAPLFISVWVQITDSLFDFFLTAHNSSLELNKKSISDLDIISDLDKDIKTTFEYIINKQNLARKLFLILVCSSSFCLLILIIFLAGIPCWNIAQYLWIRLILIAICAIQSICIFFIIYLLIKSGPGIIQRKYQYEIIKNIVNGSKNQSTKNN